MVGDPILLRYRYPNGALQAAMPLHPVVCEAERRAGWLRPGSEISYWATADGRDPRTVPIEERFAPDLTTARRTWQGSDVLRVLPTHEPYQVLHFWRDDCFQGWYINFESAGAWRGRVVDSRDWHLDLWVSPSGEGTWKDEDEAVVAVRFGHLAQQELDTARLAGERILRDFEALLSHVGDWSQVPPPQELPPLPLPEGWDHL